VFLFDSNTFIEAKNRYYAFDIVPAFWSWLAKVVQDDVRIIVPVMKELTGYGDEVSKWIVDHKDAGWVLSVDDKETQEAFAGIASELAASSYNKPGVEKFLSGADPWLIAKAQTTGATVVTHEVFDELCKRRVPIPNLCHTRGVKVMNTFEVLRHKAAKFV